MKSVAYMSGFAVGVIAVAVLAAIVAKFLNKDGKTKYDEMQELIRGRAYKYGFFAVCIYEVVMAFLTGMIDPFPLGNIVTHVGAILTGVAVQVSYCIWKDAYIGINTKMGRFATVLTVLGVLNIAFAIPAIAKNGLVVNGQLQPVFTNLVVAFLFILVGLELCIKYMVDKNRGEEE